MSQLPQEKKTLGRIVEAHWILSDGGARIREYFESLFKKRENNGSSDPDLLGMDEIIKLYRLIAVTLYDVYKVSFDSRESTGDDWTFFFWPGYDSIVASPFARRVLGNEAGSFERTHLGWALGPAAEQGLRMNPSQSKDDDNLEQKRESSLSERVLDTMNRSKGKPLKNGEEFAPGGTHSWLSRNRLLMAKSDDKTKTYPLHCLEVGVGRKDNHTAYPEQGILRITLANGDQLNWGNKVAKVLNDLDIVYPDPCAKGPSRWPWPLPSSWYEMNLERDECQNRIREDIYSLWLSASLDSKHFVSGCRRGGWIHRMAERYEPDFPWLAVEIGRLIEIVRNGKFLQGESYRYWTSIVIPAVVKLPRFGTPSQETLGSLMFLSRRPLTRGVVERTSLYMMRLWAIKHYYSIRYCETAALALQAGNEALLHHLPKDLVAHSRAVGRYNERISEIRKKNPGIEIPEFKIPDHLSVAIMFATAASRFESRLYELPADVAKLLADTWSVESLGKFIQKVVWEQAVLRVLTARKIRDKVALGQLEWKSDEDRESQYPMPKLVFTGPSEFTLMSPQGIYPLILITLRSAFQHSYLLMLKSGSHTPARIEISYEANDEGTQTVVIRNEGEHEENSEDVQLGWQRDVSLFRGLTYGWEIESADKRRYSSYDNELQLWETRIVRRKG